MNPNDKAQRRSKRSRKIRRVSIIGAVVLVIAAGAIVPPIVNQPNLEDYRDQADKLDEVISNTKSLIGDAPNGFEVDLITEIETAVDDAEALLAIGEPNPYSFTIRARADEFYEARHNMLDLTDELSTGFQARDEFDEYVTYANGLLEDAQKLHSSTGGQVAEENLRTVLADAIDSLEWELGLNSNYDSGADYESALADLEDAADDVVNAGDSVAASNESWVVAEEEKAKTDPANYDVISDRDWQLLERNANDHAGEKYVIYGYVTQADVAMGSSSIRADTSGEQLGSWYDYEINTIVVGAETDMFDNVIQGDIVKMLVEVEGSTSYDTNIGGTATAVSALAYSVEVIG